MLAINVQAQATACPIQRYVMQRISIFANLTENDLSKSSSWPITIPPTWSQ